MTNETDKIPSPRQLNRRSFAAAVGAAFAILATHKAHAAEAAGEVTLLRGAASAEAQGQQRKLTLRLKVYVGDTIATEANALIQLALGENTILRLGELSRLRLDKHVVDAGGVLSFIGGFMKFEREGPPLSAPLKFHNAYGMIAVRGTVFYAGLNDSGGFGVFVERGAVEVSGGGKTVVLDARMGTDIAAPGAQPSDPVEWGAPRVRALQSRFQ